MKPTTAWILLCFVLLANRTVIGAADVSQDRFDNANQLYEEGKYADALNQYLEIEKAGSAIAITSSINRYGQRFTT